MIYFCCEEGRRILVRNHATLNGIEHLEVVDTELKETHQEPFRQRILRVYFVSKAAASDASVLLARQEFFDRLATLSPSQVRISGGERVKRIDVDTVALHSADHVVLNPGDRSELLEGDYLEVRVTPRGDFSRYTLALVEPNADMPLRDLDTRIARVDFSFKVECESEFDCQPACDCPPATRSSPDLDYLAKDYASFRQLMLDRLATIAPGWRERNSADLGVTLVELLAYVADHLSYRQDAIANEAYLGTARQRVAIRRHAKLLDYHMHDGCNARAWVQVRLKSAAKKGVVLATESPRAVPLRFVTRLGDSAVLSEREFQRTAASGPFEVFEPMERAELFAEHNEMYFHTWGNADCCLPKGATKATLRGDFPNLQPGTVLVLIERIGAKTGNSSDADPSRRHAVRLSHVNGLDTRQFLVAQKNDSLPQREDALFDPPIKVTEIQWADDDALPFPFCLSARGDATGQLLKDVSVALGNIVLADNGMTLPRLEDLGRVPSPNPVLDPVRANGRCHCNSASRVTIPPRFHPRLQQRPLTYAASYDSDRPAVDAFSWQMSEVLPAIQLTDSRGRAWKPKHDLLSSDAFAPEFVVELENDGRAFIRFGDDENGLRPGEGTELRADYRVGNGPRGNVGRDSLVHLVADVVFVPDGSGELLPESPGDWIESVSNPLPARRGTEPELLEEVRQNAPAAFRVQQRAVTPEDYARMAGKHPEVQRAAATLRWTGSWYTVFLSVDRRGGHPVDPPFEQELRGYLERFRMAGHDLEIVGPRYVPLELELRVCVSANYFRGDVVAALQTTFDNRLHSDGSRGFFHPDHFSFGQSVFLSQIRAAAQRVAGVRHIEVAVLRRQGITTGELVPESDVFEVDRLEIVQLEHDANFPDRGVLRFNPVGGR